MGSLELQQQQKLKAVLGRRSVAWAQAVAGLAAAAAEVAGLAAAATACRFLRSTRGRAHTCCGGTGEEVSAG